jgi:long-chain acyl-CoA synthetase
MSAASADAPTSAASEVAPEPSARNVPEMLLQRLDDNPAKEAFRFKRSGGWSSLTWGEVGERVRHIAAGLRELGLEPGQRAAILAGTRVDWILADLGILAAGGATSTIYPASTPEEVAYVVGDSESRIVFAEDDDQVAKLVEVREDLPTVTHVVTIDGSAGHDGWVLTLADLEAKGAASEHASDESFRERIHSIQPEDLATLIYTSGTTGRPKGVRLSHQTWVYESDGIACLGLLHPEDLHFLWLPLAHSFGKVLLGTQLRLGFPTAVDGTIDQIVPNLADLRPTFVAAVPRIFEKIHAKVTSGVAQASWLKRTMEWSRTIRAGRPVGGWLGFRLRIADKLVLGKIRNIFGGRLRFFISGSAPLQPDLIEFLHACQVLVLEGYGLTESAAGTFVNRPDEYLFGTVGRALPGTEVRLAADGEILIRGPGIMDGYHGLEDATAETLQDGWLATGDIGELDERGFLKITDRKKDLIKTAGGKYVAPQMIEGKLKTLCPLISHVAVHGDRRKFCAALIAVDPEELEKWAERQGIPGDYEARATHQKTHDYVWGFVEKMNADLPRYSTLKKISILPKDLTVESGELTTSLKMKRRVVEKNYAHLLDAFYDG